MESIIGHNSDIRVMNNKLSYFFLLFSLLNLDSKSEM